MSNYLVFKAFQESKKNKKRKIISLMKNGTLTLLFI